MSERSQVRHVPSLRLWFGVPAVLVGVLVAVLTNIVTATPSLAGVAGLVAAVAILVGLTVWQASHDQQGRMAALRADRAKQPWPGQGAATGA